MLAKEDPEAAGEGACAQREEVAAFRI